ncbi:MAG: hypothetical protein R3C05_11600 [Pirellulaceae bacterium]
MGRFGSFLLGAVVGAGTLYTTMNFHVVRFDDGTRLIRKVSPGLTGTTPIFATSISTIGESILN